MKIVPRETLPAAVEKIEAFQAMLMEHPNRIEFEHTHAFVPGVYARTMYLPADTVLTSKIHLVENFFFLSVGHLTVFDSFGGRHDVHAPYLGITKPGTKRALYSHVDSVVTTFHPNTDDCQDIAELERRFVADSYGDET